MVTRLTFLRAFAFAALIVAGSCKSVPFTGRSQLSLLPESQMVAMSVTNYDEFISSNKLSTNQEQVQMIKKVGDRISRAVETYLKDNGYESYLESFDWEFNLVEDDVPNAWCMPGGKVVFYTGILPLTKDEAGVAVVMGHEIAHAVARHGSERMSQSLITELGGMALATAIKDEPALTQTLFNTAYGVGTEVGVMLPFSRKHEYEADHMGLIFMAMAGYDPQNAVEFWKRMSDAGGDSGTPQFLSTHPLDANRIAQLEKLMPEALKYYNKQ